MEKLKTIQNKNAIDKLLTVARELEQYRKLIEYADQTMEGQELAEELLMVTNDLVADSLVAYRAAEELVRINSEMKGLNQ